MKEEKNKIIETLVNKYLDNDLPEEVQIKFQAWMLNSRNMEEKDNALMNYANSLNPEFDYKHYKGNFEKLEAEIDTRNKSKIKERFARFGYAIAGISLLVAILSVTFVFVRKSLFSPETMVYVTSQANKGKFNLPDGSTVFLNCSSRLEVPSNFNRKTRSVKLDGEAYFDVAKDSLHPFRVLSHHFTVQVLGTTFNIKAYSGEEFAEVVLVKGSIEVSGSSLPEPILMSPDEKLTIEKNAMLEKVDVRNYISWTGHPLNIDNMPLGEIITNIEHWYNVELVPAGEVDLSARLTFVVRDESVRAYLSKFRLLQLFSIYPGRQNILLH